MKKSKKNSLLFLGIIVVLSSVGVIGWVSVERDRASVGSKPITRTVVAVPSVDTTVKPAVVEKPAVVKKPRRGKIIQRYDERGAR